MVSKGVLSGGPVGDDRQMISALAASGSFAIVKSDHAKWLRILLVMRVS